MNTQETTPSIKDMMEELHHGELGYSIIYFDRELATIDAGIGKFDKEPSETNKDFLKRIKKLVKKACEVDTVITVSN